MPQAQPPVGPYPPPPGQDIRYEHEVRLLQALDRSEPAPDNAILFTGSSIFRFWSTLAADMAPLPVINHAFGGARTWELLHFFNRIITPCRPSIIVYYCGSNDIECDQQADAIAARVQTFVELVMHALPGTSTFFVSINLSPQKRAHWETIHTVNRLVAQLCGRCDALHYIDVNPALLDAHEQPRSELYQEDGLHLRPAAYRAFTSIIKPILLQARHSSGTAHGSAAHVNPPPEFT